MKTSMITKKAVTIPSPCLIYSMDNIRPSASLAGVISPPSGFAGILSKLSFFSSSSNLIVSILTETIDMWLSKLSKALCIIPRRPWMKSSYSKRFAFHLEDYRSHVCFKTDSNGRNRVECRIWDRSIVGRFRHHRHQWEP